MQDNDEEPGWLAHKWDWVKANIAFYLISFGQRVHPQLFEVMTTQFLLAKARTQANQQDAQEVEHAVANGLCPCPDCRAERREQGKPTIH